MDRVQTDNSTTKDNSMNTVLAVGTKMPLVDEAVGEYANASGRDVNYAERNQARERGAV